MATKTAKSNASNGQQEQRVRFSSASANEIVPAGVRATSESGDTSWGDRFAFKIWLVCFALMALMVAYNTIAGLLRGFGSN